MSNEIIFSPEKKEILMTFFESYGEDFFEQTDFSAYDNLESFGNQYSSFLRENRLGDDESFLHLLLEIVLYESNWKKKTKKEVEKGLNQKKDSVSSIELKDGVNGRIREWYDYASGKKVTPISVAEHVNELKNDQGGFQKRKH